VAVLAFTSTETSRQQIQIATMSETIKLFCWVIDTPTTHIFPVKVESDEIWGGMKDAIKEKEKNKFADIDAADLDLWKVCSLCY